MYQPGKSKPPTSCTTLIYHIHTHVRRLFRCYTQNTIALQRTIIEFALFTISKIFYSAQIFQTQIFLIFITKNTKGTAIYFNSGYKFVWLLLICLRFSILFTFLLIFHILLYNSNSKHWFTHTQKCI